MNKVRWGILSTARIGVEKVIPAMQRAEHCEIAAIASRDRAKATAAAEKLGIAKAYGSYQELLADPEIDAVYNPLPNHLHVEWSVQAIEAGKHLLCEKPIALSSAQGRQLVDAAAARPELKVAEAFMYRFHPQWQRARQIVREGGVGELKTIQTFFSYYNDNPDDIRNQAEIGGGALMDIGCYPISLSRFIFEAEPERVFGILERDPNFKTDRLDSAVLDFGRGTSTYTCATQLAPYQRVNIVGSEGRVEIEIPFNAPPDAPCRMWHQKSPVAAGADHQASAGKESGPEEIVLEVCDQYGLQGDAFSRCILENQDVPTPISDAVCNMKVIEAIIESSKTGRWASV